jgi:fatty acid desaturase
MLTIAFATGTFWLFALYHLIPRFYVFSILFYWSDIQDHYRTNTGTRVQTGLLFNLLNHNEGLHAFHHIFPQVPWFNVPKGHALVPHDYDHSSSLLDSYRQMKNWKPPGNFPDCF